MPGGNISKPVAQLTGQLRPLAVPLVLFSFVTNLSVLVSPLYMMHVLDRVIPSGNMQTLTLLLMLAIAALLATAVVEYFRDQALGNSANWFERQASELVLRGGGRPADPLRAVARLSGFIGGRGATTLLDLPWIPLFLIAVFLVHPAFLLLAVVAATVFLLLSWLGDRLSEPLEEAAGDTRSQGMQALAKLEQLGAAARLMGINDNLRGRYVGALDTAERKASSARGLRNVFSSATRFARVSMQIGSLSLGAYLVTQGQLTAGGMIGASIILAKTAGIVEGAIGLFGERRELRAAFAALNEAVHAHADAKTEIADLSGALKAVDLTIPRGAGLPPRIDRISVQIAAGECLAIMGESGSGKSSLLDALAGIAPAPIGNCFLDQTDIRSLDAVTRRQAIGYVPQSGHIFPGSIAQNISRFDPDPDDAKVLAAARLAGIHGMVSALPEAYETDLGQKPYLLSAGQRQRVAFARALYDPPKYLFMDEPNALLDHQAERQMGDAIQRLKSAGTTIVMTAHRMGIVNLADRIMVMEAGRMVEIGPRADLLGRMASSHRRLRLPISGGALQDLADWVTRQFVRDGDENFKLRATTVATELYLFAKENGPEDTDRFLFFEFKFIDDVTCSVTLSEPRKTQLEAKIHKVKQLVETSLPDTAILRQDERSLATVMQIADNFEHRSDEESSAFFARITHNLPETARLN